MKSKQHIILETILFYGQDPNSRSVATGRCKYNHPDGVRHCALARCIKPEERYSLVEGDNAYGQLSTPGAFNKLLPEYAHDSKWFWQDIQGLHDLDRRWDLYNKGLSEDGLKYAKEILWRYAKN